MNYREPLPEGCPPTEAEEITAGRDVFRVVRTDPATRNDFRSQRAEKPEAVFRGATECQARGLSVFARRSDCEKLLKLSHMRGRRVCRVHLEVGGGRIQPTFQPSHHTWWPLADFDILAHSSIEVA